MRYPLLGKATALGGVLLGLMWSLWSVQGIVQERQQRQGQAEQSVANSLAGSQTLMGPVLVRNCSETWVSGHTAAPENKPIYEQQLIKLALPPTQLKLDSSVDMTPRYRGMFKVNGYAAKSLLNAQWTDLAGLHPQARHEGGRISCDDPVLSMAVSDARGIRLAEVLANGQALSVAPGSGQTAYPFGFQARLSPEQAAAGEKFSVNLSLELAGTRTLAVVPLADTNLVHVQGNWPHPSFGGRFLPSERSVSSAGFDAEWRVSSLASTAQQAWLKGEGLCTKLGTGEYSTSILVRAESDSNAAPTRSACIEAFDVDFIDPINPYVLSDRASKYGLLFIALTFVAVGLVEVLRRLRVHPMQYLLVGAALAVFFLLLVSLSEHLVFGLAYALAAAACTVLLGFYGSFVLQGARAGLAFGAGIAGLFATLYALLQMEQTALVLGSVLLFIVLAVIMVATRKLDWYALMGQWRGEPQQAAP